jgi:tetratricopeptide (TPR) repeat protein
VLVAVLLPGCGLFHRDGIPENETLSGNDASDLQRALQLERDGKEQLAEAYLVSLIERMPLSFRVHRARQDVWFACGPQGRDKMVAEYGTLPEDTAFHLSLKARVQDSPERQRELLERAVAQDSSFVWAQLGLAFLDRQAEHYEQAREHLLAALEIWREFPEALRDLAEVEETLGNYEAARERYGQYLTVRPEDRDARFDLAVLLATAFTDAQGADQQFVQILVDHPDDLDALYGHATMLARQRDYEQAIKIYQQVLHNDAHRADIYYNLGWIYETMGDDRKARDYYQQFLDVNPAGVDSRSVLDKLFFVPNHLHTIDERLQRSGS